MAQVQDPHRDLPPGVRGGSDTWDQPQASVVLDADWFAASLIAPVITLNPADQTAGLGATATFTAAATGTPAPTWQWQVLRTA